MGLSCRWLHVCTPVPFSLTASTYSNSSPGPSTLESVVKGVRPPESSGTDTVLDPTALEGECGESLRVSGPTLDSKNPEDDSKHVLESSETDAFVNQELEEGLKAHTLSPSTSDRHNAQENVDNPVESPENDAHIGPEELEGQPLMSGSTAAEQEWNRAKENNDPSDLPNPKSEVQRLTTPAYDWNPLIMPIGMFIAGAALAFCHHAFNALLDGKPVSTIVISQDWVTRIGVSFSFGFQTVVGITMGFVLLQCLWLSILRKPLTIRELDTLYQVERLADLYKTLPQALPYSPILVLFSVITLLIPISGVFAPGSLTVVTHNSTDVRGPCTIPTGNLSAANTSDSTSLFVTGGFGYWETVTPRATKLTTEWFVNQRIPDLPQACGPNCRYKVSVPSFVFQCSPNPSSLPAGQAGVVPADPANVRFITLWNGTADSTSEFSFYIAWTSHSKGNNGTSGNAYCLPVEAQYDVEVRTKDGVQSVTTNITQTTTPVPDVANSTFVADKIGNTTQLDLWMQLASLSYATKALFLGSAVLKFGMSSTFVDGNTQASQASFLDIPVLSALDDPAYIWGDVLKGVEEMSHNVTAAILSLQLGTMDAECLFDQQTVVYKYDTFALWAPYGTALGVALLSLGVAILIMIKKNTGNITSSFSDTILLTRRLQEDISPGTKLRLRAVKGEDRGYVAVWT